MTTYGIEKYADVPKEMEQMHKEDPKQRGKEMKPKCEAAPQATHVGANA